MRGLRYCKLKVVWAKAKKRKVLIIALFILLVAIAAGIIVWGLKTGRFRFFAAVDLGCPVNTICNQATLTYIDTGGVVRTIDSNVAMIVPTASLGGANIKIVLPVSSKNYASNNVSLKVYPVGQSVSVFENNNIVIDSSGNSQNNLSGLVVGQSYDFKLKVNYFLTKVLRNVVFSENMTLDFGALRGGDLNNDNIVNGLDFTYLVNKWTQNDPIADINKDGTVNNADFVVIDANWFMQGD